MNGESIGLENMVEVRKMIEKNCVWGRRGGTLFRHLMVRLDGEETRKELLEYMANLYRSHHVLSFENGLDDVLMLSFDGTLPQLRRVFQVVEDASVYANSAFDGIIGMDLTELARNAERQTISRFFGLFRETCSHAAVVFFFGGQPNRREERLAEQLMERVEGVYRVEQPEWAQEEIVLPGYAV